MNFTRHVDRRGRLGEHRKESDHPPRPNRGSRPVCRGPCDSARELAKLPANWRSCRRACDIFHEAENFVVLHHSALSTTPQPRFRAGIRRERSGEHTGQHSGRSARRECQTAAITIRPPDGFLESTSRRFGTSIFRSKCVRNPILPPFPPPGSIARPTAERLPPGICPPRSAPLGCPGPGGLGRVRAGW